MARYNCQNCTSLSSFSGPSHCKNPLIQVIGEMPWMLRSDVTQESVTEVVDLTEKYEDVDLDSSFVRITFVIDANRSKASRKAIH